MKKIILMLVIFCSQHYLIFSQGRTNIYLFGYTGPYRGNMDLKSGFPIITADSIRKFKISYTHANISDVNGNLLFYTNGVTVMDGNHDTMPNGTGLNPCQYTTDNMYGGLTLYQGDIIIPFPDDSQKYYLFHQSFDYYSISSASQIYYSVIDMSLNSGHGDVVQKNTSFFQDTLYGGGVTACKHANGRDWWLIVPRAFSPTYHLFLITPAGVQFSSTQTIGNRIYIGQTAFSPDGSHFGYYDHIDDVEVFDFDRCNGTLSNEKYVAINDSNWGLGFCFSPNSKLAYAASAHFLYQFNLDSANLANSMDTVAVWDSTYNPFLR